MGEPLSVRAWRWYNKIIGKENCTLVDTWWQTGRQLHDDINFLQNLIKYPVFFQKLVALPLLLILLPVDQDPNLVLQ